MRRGRLLIGTQCYVFLVFSFDSIRNKMDHPGMRLSKTHPNFFRCLRHAKSPERDVAQMMIWSRLERLSRSLPLSHRLISPGHGVTAHVPRLHNLYLATHMRFCKHLRVEGSKRSRRRARLCDSRAPYGPYFCPSLSCARARRTRKERSRTAGIHTFHGSPAC